MIGGQSEDFRIVELMATLHPGKANAIGRRALAAEMDMRDRDVRKLIEKARNEGHLILNDQDGKGYYLPDSTDDLVRQYKQDTNRAMSILTRRKHIRNALKEAGIRV